MKIFFVKPYKNYTPGKLVNLADKTAQRLIDKGYAMKATIITESVTK